MTNIKKITSKLNKIRYVAQNNKTKSAMFFIILIIGVLLSAGIYIIYVRVTDKNDVTKMRTDIRDISSELQAVDGTRQWNDISHCTTYRPRMFGDKVRYTCDASYEAVYDITDKESMDVIIKRHYSILEKNDNLSLSSDILPPYVRESDTDTGKYRQIRSFNFMLLSTNTDKCSINYDLNAVDVGYSLSVNIRCYQDTRKAYFEPVRYI